MTLSTERDLLRTPFERDVFAYWTASARTS